MSAPVCRYFLNNNCRFGDRCRFSHNVSESSYGSSQSQNPYVLNRNQSHNRQGYEDPKRNWKLNVTHNDIQELIDKIRDEAKSVEYENMWPLTCLSVMKEGANVPGWEDYSMEELRTAAYSAKLVGRFDEYVKLYQSLLRKAKEARSVFLNPGKKAEETVKLMLEKRGQDGGSAISSFSFAQGLASGELGRGGSSPGSIFGSQSPPFGGAFGSMPFGSGASDPAAGIFAMAAQGFVPNTSQGSVLNDTDMETASESLLNQSSAASPFHQNIFGQVAQQKGRPAQENVFGNAATSSPFGNTTAKTVDLRVPPSVFGGSSATSSVFGGAPTTSSTFGGAPASASGVPASSPFSSSQGTSEDDNLYTPMSQLSESDLEQFKAEKFTLSKIPHVPPPRELC